MAQKLTDAVKKRLTESREILGYLSLMRRMMNEKHAIVLPPLMERIYNVLLKAGFELDYNLKENKPITVMFGHRPRAENEKGLEFQAVLVLDLEYKNIERKCQIEADIGQLIYKDDEELRLYLITEIQRHIAAVFGSAEDDPFITECRDLVLWEQASEELSKIGK